MSIKQVAIALIRQDGETQPRIGRHPEWCEDYASDMAEGRWDWSRPGAALTVFFDGASYWLADGFHRLDAAESAGLSKVRCDVRKGTQRDAQLFACGANAVHGQRRTNDDKRRAVAFLLADEEWSRWSDNEIAKRCAVSQPFVAKLRAASSNDLKIAADNSDTAPPSADDGEIPAPQKAKRTATRGGKTYAMDTSKIGKGANGGKRKPRKPPAWDGEPDEEPGEAYERVKPDEPIEDCLSSVRRVVLAAIHDIAVCDWPELITKLRKELNDIEDVLKRRSADGRLHAPH